jgi:dTDP-4-dehydrorhamnose 3,5-epimerase
MEFLSLVNQEGLIDGVKLHKLVVHRDDRGLLMETLKTTWEGVVDDSLPFGQTYFSVTNPGFARDEDEWHNHPTRQVDRFVVLKGDCVIAVYDKRDDSATRGKLNLFFIGESNGDDNQYLLLIPKNVLHSTCNVGNEPLLYLGNPTHVYDPNEEGRLTFAEVGALLPDGTPFSWQAVRDHFTPKP